MDEILAIGAQSEDEEVGAEQAGAKGARMPDPEALVKAIGASYPLIGYSTTAGMDVGEDESPLDPLILDGLIHV